MNSKRLILAAALLGGALVAPASASSLQHTVGAYSHHGGHSSCNWRGHTYAGTLMIDGRRTIIRSDRDVKYQIVCAFRRAGYGASYDRGQVLIHYRYCRPNVRWYADGYKARFDWRNGCVRISLFNQSCGPCANKGGHGHGYDDGYYHKRDRWQRRPGRPNWPTRRYKPGRCG